MREPIKLTVYGHPAPQGSTFIYALSDPRTGEVRYVGKSNNPELRAADHRRRSQSNKAKKEWVEDLRMHGLFPKLSILEIVPFSEWQIRERYWIEHRRSSGDDLFNIATGGGGTTVSRKKGSLLPRETRAKISASLKGNPILSQCNIGNKHSLGCTHSQSTKDRIRRTLTGHSVSKSTREKIGSSLRGRRLSAEVRAKMGASRLGNRNSVGRKATEETLLKMRSSQRQRRQRERQ